MSCPAEVFTSPIQLIWQVAFGLRLMPEERKPDIIVVRSLLSSLIA
jgi:hypothetical protein